MNSHNSEINKSLKILEEKYSKEYHTTITVQLQEIEQLKKQFEDKKDFLTELIKEKLKNKMNVNDDLKQLQELPKTDNDLIKIFIQNKFKNLPIESQEIRDLSYQLHKNNKIKIPITFNDHDFIFPYNRKITVKMNPKESKKEEIKK